MKETWRKLRVGDHVRFVGLPMDFSKPGYYVHRDTLRVYRLLIERRRPARVAFLRDWGDWKVPWIRCRFRGKDGRIEYHSLAIDHDDGWVRVKHRPKSRAIKKPKSK
jgi:hypothetical protein